MALRDQPYLPLYIQDFMTDEKLLECSASATGVYIRIMCIMHKSSPYGTFLLKQKDKKTNKQILNFANKLAKSLPYKVDVILDGLTELLEEDCLQIDGDTLIQKRMFSDGELSLIRSKSGKLGSEIKEKNKGNFAIAKVQANSEIEYINEIDIDNETVLEGGAGETWKTKPSAEEIDMELNPVKGGAVIEMFKFSKNHDLTKDELTLLWSIFKAQNFTGEKFYKSKNDVYSHFINWSKMQTVNGKSDSNQKKGNGSNYKTAGQDVYIERLKRQYSELNGD
jgi:uncharacterized protein YdaU (DUF1376 family)